MWPYLMVSTTSASVGHENKKHQRAKTLNVKTLPMAKRSSANCCARLAEIDADLGFAVVFAHAAYADRGLFVCPVRLQVGSCYDIKHARLSLEEHVRAECCRMIIRGLNVLLSACRFRVGSWEGRAWAEANREQRPASAIAERLTGTV